MKDISALSDMRTASKLCQIGFLWQAIASYYEYNVSATHSIIGAIIGFSLVYGGADAVNWATPDKASFPPYKGVVPIICSWFFSPVLTGAASALIFVTVRTLVLRRANSYGLSFWVLPPFVCLTTWINIYFVFTRGAKKMLSETEDDWSDAKAAWISACVAAGVTLLTIVIVLPLLRWKANRKFEEDDRAAAKEAADAEAGAGKTKGDEEEEVRNDSKFLKACKSMRDAVMYGMEQDMHSKIDTNPVVAAIHKAEYAFSYLQVFSAVCVIFAHGAGEVGYMAGPLTMIWYVVKDGVLPSKVNAPIWAIIIGAMGLVVGLATYGYKVTAAVGTAYAKLSPTRGFAAELSTALVIMIAAQYGLPTSSSQCITGGIVGVGLVENVKTGVNWKFLGKTFISWACTLFVVGLGTGALFAQGCFSPSISANKVIYNYEQGVITLGQSVVRDINTTLYSYKNASEAGRLSRLPNATWWYLDRTIKAQVAQGRTWLTPKTTGTVLSQNALGYLYTSLSLLSNTSMVTLGQEQSYAGASTCNSNSFNPASPAFTSTCGTVRPLRSMPPPQNSTTWTQTYPPPASVSTVTTTAAPATTTTTSG
ncbi:hypothetical protein HXX76_006784 [Chlamydomonas incerta]|uniref:Phosphate transporter n=1 Tax=Chlamydomonas incerta TaxID=51695 RepID=A0A835W412_CHLIN|nr:hypothetical protein HXX76_006784 [Chlamydomonas incerta]|eukprot:KAG2436483.1 hypothetical protein HXX76_006784 [Chlamydomonas incerta]